MRILSRHNVNLKLSDLAHVMRQVAGRSESSVIQTFERRFADYLGVPHAVATGNGRTALYLALKALELPDRAVVAVPAYAFYAVPAVVKALGLRMAFVPMDRRTHAIDAARLDEAMPPETRALIVIQPFGQSANMDDILAVCNRRDIHVVEDASQSIGGAYRGKKLGAWGVAAAFSLVPGKNMTAGGGGMMATSDSTLARRAQEILDASSAIDPRGRPLLPVTAQWLLTSRPGFALGMYPAFLAISTLDHRRLDRLFEEAQVPFQPETGLVRMHARQAALGIVQLDRLDRLNDIRRRNAEALLACLRGTPGLELPEVVRHCTATFNAFPVRVDRARDLRRALLRRGIDTREDYMRWFDGSQRKRDDILYLPNHPGLDQGDMVYIARTVRAIMSAR